jgi:hypothetical protein
MLLDYSVPGEVKIAIQKYIDDVLELAKVRGQASTPATVHLFDVDEEAAVLIADEKRLFSRGKTLLSVQACAPGHADSSIVPDDQGTGTDSRRLW